MSIFGLISNHNLRKDVPCISVCYIRVGEQILVQLYLEW
jgi:hypothetical protein